MFITTTRGSFTGASRADKNEDDTSEAYIEEGNANMSNTTEDIQMRVTQMKVTQMWTTNVRVTQMRVTHMRG